MTVNAAPVVRVVMLVGAVALLGVGLTMGYVAAIAARRSEGVFMPAGYVALICLVGGVFLLRAGLKG